mmetsp:Transcript_12973/g.38220  ORF Transcript_12973/g.38220 Transcript_12973/m.38220 type:complete len:247 (+) Transcript_12973:277-1017(+)
MTSPRPSPPCNICTTCSACPSTEARPPTSRCAPSWAPRACPRPSTSSSLRSSLAVRRRASSSLRSPRCGRTCCCSTSRPTTSTCSRSTPSSRRSTPSRGASSSSHTTAACSRRPTASCGCVRRPSSAHSAPTSEATRRACSKASRSDRRRRRSACAGGRSSAASRRRRASGRLCAGLAHAPVSPRRWPSTDERREPGGGDGWESRREVGGSLWVLSLSARLAPEPNAASCAAAPMWRSQVSGGVRA